LRPVTSFDPGVFTRIFKKGERSGKFSWEKKGRGLCGKKREENKAALHVAKEEKRGTRAAAESTGHIRPRVKEGKKAKEDCSGPKKECPIAEREKRRSPPASVEGRDA